MTILSTDSFDRTDFYAIRSIVSTGKTRKKTYARTHTRARAYTLGAKNIYLL